MYQSIIGICRLNEILKFPRATEMRNMSLDILKLHGTHLQRASQLCYSGWWQRWRINFVRSMVLHAVKLFLDFVVTV